MMWLKDSQETASPPTQKCVLLKVTEHTAQQLEIHDIGK